MTKQELKERVELLEKELLNATIDNIGLKHDAEFLTNRLMQCKKAEDDLYDLRGWLRVCSDDPEGHTEFYQWACHVIFNDPAPEETK